MSEPGGPIEIGPVIITDTNNPPPVILPPPPVGVPGGLGDRPPVWDANIPTSAQVEDFFNKKDIFALNKIQAVVLTVAAGQKNVEASYVAHLPNVPSEVDYEINSSVGTEVLSPLEKAIKEKAVVDQLITLKQSELGVSTVTANSYFGRNPLDKDADLNGVDFLIRFQDRKNPLSPLALYNEFISSVSAAYTSKILTEKIRLLTEKSTALTSSIATEQAAEDARLAAEAEAKRIADEAATAEAARVAAEAEAKRVADEAAAAEAARVAAEAEAEAEAQRVAAEAAEQARLAAEAEAARVAAEAAEQARLAAEAEAKRIADEAAAAEAARLAVEAEAKRVADEAAAVEAARIAAEAEAKRIADEAAAAEAARVAAEAAALKAALTYRLPAAGATQLSTAAGPIAITSGSGITLDALIQAIKAVLGTIVSVPTAVGIGLLSYSSSLGNGELPATMLNLPAKGLAPDLPDNLLDLAAAGGTVNVPYRIYGDQSKYSVVATQATGGLAATVPVRALVLDPVANAYTFTTTDTPPITLTFPIAVPGNSTTATPAQPVETPVYTGITLTPIEVKAEPFPAASQLNIRDGIYVYPSDSGLPPIYAVFSSPYEGATTKGEHSGRMYNPDKAGGPTQDLDWTTASVTQEGIDLVKLHTGRFDPSDANVVMIDRLEKILTGELAITDVDKRFYTHEIRELERYRALGVADGVEPKDGGAIWNNTHAATLEDYKLKDGSDVFYTPEAIAAYNKQTYGE